MKKKSLHWKSFNTKILKEIIANQGTTNAGTAYDFALDEIEDELLRRAIKQDKKASQAALKAIDYYESVIPITPPPISEEIGLPPIIDESIYNIPF